MHTLSEGMTRICDEIVTLRQQRERLLSGVRRETRDRKFAVSQMLAQFLQGLAEIAQRERAGRIVLLTDLKQAVSILQQEIRQDLSGVREALSRLRSATRSPAVRMLQNQEAETHGRCEESPRRKADQGGPCSRAVKALTQIERSGRRHAIRHHTRP